MSWDAKNLREAADILEKNGWTRDGRVVANIRAAADEIDRLRAALAAAIERAIEQERVSSVSLDQRDESDRLRRQAESEWDEARREAEQASHDIAIMWRECMNQD